MSKKISREMTIEDIFSFFPQKSQRLAQELTNIGLSCAGCASASFETIESGLLSHGFEEEKVDEVIDRLNTILDEEVDLTKITMTESAAKKFLEICKQDGKIGYALRLEEQAAGCSGLEYSMDFSKEANEDDLTFTSNNVDIHIHKNDAKRLVGCQVDYVDGLQGAGFKITNPNVKSSCGCGSSHGY